MIFQIWAESVNKENYFTARNLNTTLSGVLCMKRVYRSCTASATFDLLLLQWSCSVSNNKTLRLYWAAPRCESVQLYECKAAQCREKSCMLSRIRLGKKTVGAAAVVRVTDPDCRLGSRRRSTWHRGSWMCRCVCFLQTPASFHSLSQLCGGIGRSHCLSGRSCTNT